MPHRARRRRSPGEWAMRGLLAVAVATVGYAGTTWSLAQVFAKRDAVAAYRLAPYDGRITALAAAALSGEGASPADRLRSDVLARAALRRDPVAVVAVSTLATNAWVSGDIATARRLFNFAETLSRRDFRTQLWQIEDAVARGDVPGALRHHDIALRAKPELSGVLFPVLASASADPKVRPALIRTLAAKPLWGEGFVSFMAGHAPDPQSLAALLSGLRRVRATVPPVADAAAVDGLLAAGLRDHAWIYYGTIRPRTDRRSSRDPRFASAIEVPTQLDWVPVDGPGITVSIQGGLADILVSASVGGPLLRQLQLLPPGDYGLRGHSIGIDQAEDARPYWTLTCANGRELGRVALPNSSQANGEFAGRFSVPAGCPVQTLALVARPSDAVGGLSGQIDRVQLAPLR